MCFRRVGRVRRAPSGRRPPKTSKNRPPERERADGGPLRRPVAAARLLGVRDVGHVGRPR
jgi:hypothetical protein